MTPQHTKHETPRNTPSNTPWIFLVFSGFFFLFRCPAVGGIWYVGLVVFAYFGVCGVFCSVVGSWVVNSIHFQVLPDILAFSGNADVQLLRTLTRVKIRGFERGWREGVGNQQHPKYSKIVPQNCVLLLTRRAWEKGCRKKKRGLNLCCGRDFLTPTPSVRQPLFETSDKRTGHTSPLART